MAENDIPKIGLFIKDYLRSHREASPAEIHRAYKQAYKDNRTARGGKYKLGTYQSQVVYISGLIVMGLLERTGRTEESGDIRAELAEFPEKVYIRLSRKGRAAPDYVWSHPLRLYYRPFDWERATYGEYIRA